MGFFLNENISRVRFLKSPACTQCLLKFGTERKLLYEIHATDKLVSIVVWNRLAP